MTAPLALGEIIAAHGRHYLVDCGEAGLIVSAPRGKKSIYACGDRVSIRATGAGQGVIESAMPRKTEFFRASAHRTKLIAANATQVAVVAAAEPSFSDEFIARALIAGEHQGMNCLIVLNKSDLTESFALARARLRPFEQAGYRVIELAARCDVGPLRPQLRAAVTILVGQSGMGKTTLINSLLPGTGSATQEISRFLDSGRHTTAHARLYRIDDETALIDCPGLQEFGLAHLGYRDIEWNFPEFRSLIGTCRFQDCRHDSEPGCAMRAACAQGKIHPRRFELFRRIVAEIRAR
ncbi:MAG: ribosome small subunit-dependent GTPase A [Betaproteobacteria bacterium]|nr:ribosome small subunit-dependent GTPase A [Betaproteobacteria bacterium]